MPLSFIESGQIAYFIVCTGVLFRNRHNKRNSPSYHARTRTNTDSIAVREPRFTSSFCPRWPYYTVVRINNNSYVEDGEVFFFFFRKDTILIRTYTHPPSKPPIYRGHFCGLEIRTKQRGITRNRSVVFVVVGRTNPPDSIDNYCHYRFAVVLCDNSFQLFSPLPVES